jgi:hypothetical protein
MSSQNNHKTSAEVRAQLADIRKRQEEEAELRRKEAEELASQLAEAEAAEAMEQEAEDERKRAEDEEAERKRAAEVAKEQGTSAGTGEQPMDVDEKPETTEEKTKKTKKKGKGKAKKEAEEDDDEEVEAYELINGENRCRTCMRDDTECRVKAGALVRWREQVEAGRVTARAPSGTSCERCNTILKKPCDFLGTADLREKMAVRRAELAEERKKVKKETAEMKTGAVAGGSGASGSKRKAGAVELPPAKKKRATEPEVTEGEFRTRMLAAAERVADAVEFIHHDLQLHTVLLQRSVAMKEAVAARGDLPRETWVWGRREGTEMQDEDEEWLEAEEEEGSEEESEEEGAEEESGKK